MEGIVQRFPVTRPSSMLLLSLLLLTFGEVRGLQRREHTADHLRSLNGRAFQQLNEIIEKVAGLKLKNARDIQQGSVSEFARAVDKIGNSAQNLLDALSIHGRALSKGMMTDSQEEHVQNNLRNLASVSSLDERDLKNGFLMKIEDLKNLGRTAEKLASGNVRDLRQELMSKSTGDLQEINQVVREVLGLKSLNVREQKNGLVNKLGKNVNQRNKTPGNLASLASVDSFHWSPHKQGSLQKSERGVNQRDQTSNKVLGISSIFDWWFPHKEGSLHMSERNVNQRDQTAENVVGISSLFDWIPRKQGSLQKSERNVNQRDQTSDKVLGISSLFDWIPLKQRSPQKSERKVNQRDQTADKVLGISSVFDWIPLKQGSLQKSERKVNQRDQTANKILGISSVFDWIPLKQGSLQKSERKVNQRDQTANKVLGISSIFDWIPLKQGSLQKSERKVNQRDQTADKDLGISSLFDWFPRKRGSLQKSERDITQRDQTLENLAGFSSISKSGRAVKQRLSKDGHADPLYTNGFYQFEHALPKDKKRVKQRDQVAKSLNERYPASALDWKIGLLPQLSREMNARESNKKEQSKHVSTDDRSSRLRRGSVKMQGGCFYVCDDVCDPICHVVCEHIC
ncbi:uncharacterized protein LOC123523019 isoform X1 [Mercenaria mercenaria]|uniref:uncharacterized protein LOC123523019 isoform X1 n=2 Tax=Mercenaria mercenaria TaxID=6596 RepID=UPI00234E472F|nr:uncharacterized protein LOC123523019 isoform X1 [Mercenaria mercenaria]